MRTRSSESRGPWIGDRKVAEIIEGCPLPSQERQRNSRVARARRELDDAMALQGGVGEAPSLQAFVRSLTDGEQRALEGLCARARVAKPLAPGHEGGPS